MAKSKETPWTEQKVMYKDGNVEVYRKFGWETWKRMTEDERAMWTELSEDTPAPISKEVIEFNKKQGEVIEVTHPVSIENPEVIVTTATYSEEAKNEEIDSLRAELKARGIRFTHNSKLVTLQKKLADANDSE